MRSSDHNREKTPPVALARARSGRTIETVLLASTACLLAAVAWPIATGAWGSTSAEDGTTTDLVSAPNPVVAPVATPPGEGPVIQIALLLDTSSSMDGLIDQARTQLWSVVNTLDSATFHADRPRLEIALYEYGNDGLGDDAGYIRQVRPFTSELDGISEALFALTTNGGQEYAGQVIDRSLSDLEWRKGSGVLRVAYIAGNEGFDQGPVPYTQALSGAKAKGVVVNTVYCGGADESDAWGWRDAASVGGGRFLSIDQNHVVQHIAAPQDDEIATLGKKINDTYVRYGVDGSRGLDNLVAQDNNMAQYGVGSVVTRSISKGSHMYRNDSWDLVDALDSKQVDLGAIDMTTLPGALQQLDEGGLREHLEGKRSERAAFQSQLAELGKQRAVYVERERARRSAEDPDGLDAAILDAIREQAAAAGFTLTEA